jgi:hypothetical protein
MAFKVLKQFRGKDISGVRDFAAGEEVSIGCADLIHVALREGWVIDVAHIIPQIETVELISEPSETDIFEDFAKKKKTKK